MHEADRLRARVSWGRGRRLVVALCAASALAMLAGGCQEKAERTVSLTQEQWKRVKHNVSDEAPKPAHVVNAVFGKNGQPLVELVGWAMEPRSLVTGKPFALTWYWKSLAKTETNWRVFVHLQPKSRGAFQNLDHHPVDNLYQTSLWEPGRYITDTQNSSLQAGFSSSDGWLHIGLYDVRSGERLDVLELGKGELVEPGKLRVGEVGTKNDKELVAYRVAQAPEVDGDLGDDVWRVAGRTASFVNAADGKPVSFATTAKAIYTEEALYLAFDARDTDLQTTFTKRDDHLWEQDCVEIYLNPDNDDGTYWELQISPGDGADGKPPIFDAYFEKHRSPAWKIAMNNNLAGLDAAVQRRGTLNSTTKKADDTGYTVEVRIPFATLGNTPGAIERIRLPQVPPEVGTTWRMNFFRVDLQKSGAKDEKQHAAWSPSGGDFHNLEAFGTLRFDEAKDPAAGRAVQPNEARVRASVVSHGQGIVSASLAQASRASEPRLLDCVDLAGPRPETLASARFKVEVDAEGNVTQVIRPTTPSFAASAIDCMVDEIGGWKVARQAHRSNRARAPVARPAGGPAGAGAAPADSPAEAGTAETEPEMVVEPTTFAVKVTFSPARAAQPASGTNGATRTLPPLGAPAPRATGMGVQPAVGARTPAVELPNAAPAEAGVAAPAQPTPRAPAASGEPPKAPSESAASTP